MTRLTVNTQSQSETKITDGSLVIKLYRPRGLNPLFDQREELPILPFGNPIGTMPVASRRVS